MHAGLEYYRGNCVVREKMPRVNADDDGSFSRSVNL